MNKKVRSSQGNENEMLVLIDSPDVSVETRPAVNEAKEDGSAVRSNLSDFEDECGGYESNQLVGNQLEPQGKAIS